MSEAYKPSWKRISLLALGLIALVGGIFFLVKRDPEPKSRDSAPDDYSFEALIEVEDQTSDDPVVDRRLNLKKGDVLVVFPKGHEWAEAEKKSHLILKLKISPEEAAKLVEADVGDEGLVSLRAYRIKTESLEFDPNVLTEKQPFWDKVYDWGMVEKKEM